MVQSAQNRIYLPFDILADGVGLIQLLQQGFDVLICNIVRNIAFQHLQNMFDISRERR